MLLVEKTMCAMKTDDRPSTVDAETVDGTMTKKDK